MNYFSLIVFYVDRTPYLHPFVGDNEVIENLVIPEWMRANYEVYTRSDLVKTLLGSDLEGRCFVLFVVLYVRVCEVGVK